ncbi:MAG: energy transducer TonB, partial [Bacteroidetes bacterium]
MELKKNDGANIEKSRLAFTAVGFLFVGSLVLASFSYKVGKISEDEEGLGPKTADVKFVQEEVKDTPPPPDTPPPTVDAPPPPQEEIVEEENTETEPETIVTPPPPVDLGPIDQPVIEAEIVDFPDVEATFPGGAAEMQRWINSNVQYPQTSIEMNEQGRVYLSFVVEPDGSITNVTVERGVSGDLDKEAKRVVRSMPKWTPGEAAGKKVRT